MTSDIKVLTDAEIKNLDEKIKEKKESLESYSHEKLVFERERCAQILNRNIPMCLSQYTKNILQSNSRDKILGQLHRLNLECYWKILNLEYLRDIEKQLAKILDK